MYIVQFRLSKMTFELFTESWHLCSRSKYPGAGENKYHPSVYLVFSYEFNTLVCTRTCGRKHLAHLWLHSQPWVKNSKTATIQSGENASHATVPDWTERGRGFFTWSHVSIHSLGSTSIAEQSEYKSTHSVLMLAVPWRQSLLSGGEQAVCSEANQGPPHHIKDKIVRFSQR